MEHVIPSRVHAADVTASASLDPAQFRQLRIPQQPAFDDALQALRDVAHIRHCAAQLAAFRFPVDAKAKFGDAERRALGDLLMAVDKLVPGCPADAVLFGRLDEPPGALDARLEKLQQELQL